MKVLLTTDTVGGVWDHCVTLATHLDAAGHRVLLAVLGEPRDVRLARIPVGVEVVWRPYRLEWMPDAAAEVPAAAAWLAELATLWQADVVHCNQMAYAAFGLGAPTLTAVHSDVLSWYSEVQCAAAGPEWDEYRGWVRAGLAASDAVVAPTRYQADLTARHYGVADVAVVHNGVEPGPAEPAPRTDGFHVLCAGRLWDEGKDVATLDAAAGLCGVPVHALGETEGPGADRFRPRHVQAHGRVERAEVDRWMSAAPAYCAPSRYEPFGLAPLEAALHGCALVLSDCGSFRELWQGCAEFFPRGDARALADVLGRLAAEPKHVERLARGARTRALRRYTAERMATEYLALYETTIAAARRRAATSAAP